MYTPLYVKSNYSFLSSLVRIDDLIKRCKDLSIKQVALCDDNMIATMYFYKTCKENDIKPIISCELTYDNHSLLLYAKSFKGYQNLLKIVSNKDSISLNLLSSFNADVLAIIPYIDKELFKDISNIFDTYLGYSNKDEEENAYKLSSKCVFINKILYVNKNDSKYFKYSIMLKDKKNVLDDIEYVDNNNYLLSDSEVNNLVNNGINSTNIIGNMCNVTISSNDNLIPIYENSLGVSSSEYLTKLSIQGLTLRLKDNVSDVYKKRLLYELDIIKKMGFSDYFLIVYDYVKYAKKNKILVGPGRGSAGGSLVAYALGIIDVDPIKYDLLFERFLNPGRVTMPDIDIDFPDEYRDQVIQYTKNKYGEKKVAGIVAIGTLKAKAVLDDVSKVLKINQDKVDRLKKFIGLNDRLKNVYDNNSEFKNIIDNDDRLTLLYNVSLFFEGFPKNTTTHASGIVICKNDLDDIIPLIKQDDMYITSFEMGYLEELGLLKMDFLGNRNLTIVMNILKSIEECENKNINFLDIPLDDKYTLKLFYDADTNGIFQFESDAMKNLLKNIKVTNFDDVVAANALIRPGPDVDTYIKRKNENIDITYQNEKIEKILGNTYGVLVYQEQIMQIANVVAGFSMSDADLLRRAMSKKKKDILKVQEEKFINGAIKNGYDYNTAKGFYDDILPFAQYGFNKSHAVAYSMIAYKMAYLKVHYSKYFYLNILSMIIGNDLKTQQIIREARSRGVNFYLPSINESSLKYEIFNDGLLFPLSNIRNVGISTANVIIDARKDGFNDIFDCLTKLVDKGINRKTIESLIYASCFDSFGFNKNTLITNLDNLLNYAFISKGISSDIIEHPSIEEKEEFSKDILMAKEKELFGFYLSYHPTTKYKDKYNVINIKSLTNNVNKIVDVILLVDRVKTHTDKNNKMMAFVQGSDELDSISCTIFSKLYEEVSEIKKGDVILVRGMVEKRKEIQIIAQKVKIIG